MTADIDHEKQLANEFQLQKENTDKFWNTTKHERDDLKLQLRQKLREKQDLEEKHAFELKVYKQKVKHLLHEGQHAAVQTRIDHAEVLRGVEDGDRQRERELRNEIRELRKLQRERENSHWAMVTDMRIAQDKRITSLREEFTRRAGEAKEYFEQVTNDAIAGLDADRRAEVGRLENKLHAFTQRLLGEHQAQLRDMQAYYRDLKFANLALIKALKADVARLQTADERLSRQVAGVSRLHKKLQQPLHENQEKLAKLRARLAVFEEEQKELAQVSSSSRQLESQVQTLEWEHEVLLQRVERVKGERDQLRAKLEGTVQRVREHAKFREALLERKVVAASVDVEKTATAVHEIAAASGLADLDGDVKNSLEAVLVAKNMTIQHLENMLVDIRQRHRASMERFETQLQAHDFTVEALGFEIVKDI